MNTLTEENQKEENQKVSPWENFKKHQTKRVTNQIKEKMWKERKFIGGLAWKALSSAGSKAVNISMKARTRKNRKNRKDRKTRKTRKTRNRKY